MSRYCLGTVALRRLIVLLGLTCWLLNVGAAPETDSQRIVSLSPNVTEILFAMGITNTLVGISDYCSPPAGVDLPRCGGPTNPNLERILGLHPTMIFLLGRMDKVQRFADQNGLHTTSIEIDSSAQLYREIQRIAGLVGVPRQSWNLLQHLESQKKLLLKRNERLPKYRTLLLLGRQEGSVKKMMAVGGPSFISEMLTLANGENIFTEQKKPYFEVSLESIIALQPEVIFEIRSGKSLTPEQTEKIKEEWKDQDSIPAVKRGRVVVVTNDFFSIPGPRMFDIAENLAEQFKKITAEDPERKP